MGLFTPSNERLTQLYFRDDGKFEFIKRELQDGCLVEKDKGELKRAWKHFYGNQLSFPGYKRIPAAMVTLGYSRDIILDVFDRIPKGEELNQKPDTKVKDNLKTWIAKIGENQRHKYAAKRETTYMSDRISWALIILSIILALFWGIRFALGG